MVFSYFLAEKKGFSRPRPGRPPNSEAQNRPRKLTIQEDNAHVRSFSPVHIALCAGMIYSIVNDREQSEIRLLRLR